MCVVEGSGSIKKGSYKLSAYAAIAIVELFPDTVYYELCVCGFFCATPL